MENAFIQQAPVHAVAMPPARIAAAGAHPIQPAARHPQIHPADVAGQAAVGVLHAPRAPQGHRSAITRLRDSWRKPGTKHALAGTGTALVHLCAIAFGAVAVANPPKPLTSDRVSSIKLNDGVGYSLVACGVVGAVGDVCMFVWSAREIRQSRMAPEEVGYRPDTSRLQAGSWGAAAGGAFLNVAALAQIAVNALASDPFKLYAIPEVLVSIGAAGAVASSIIRAWGLWNTSRAAPLAAAGPHGIPGQQPGDVQLVPVAHLAQPPRYSDEFGAAPA